MSITGTKMARNILLAVVVIMMFCTNAYATEEQTKLSYPEVGITKSMLFRPSIGYWWNHAGVRLSGMYLDKDQQDFQFNMGYAFYDKVKMQQSINLVTFWVVGSDPGADYKYAATGLTYSINYRGFFLELGLAVPWRDDIGNLEDDPVVPCLSVGYIYRFISK